MSSWTVGQIAYMLGGTVEGESETLLTGILPLSDALGEHLSFLHRARYLEQARKSRAGAILVKTGVVLPGSTLIIVDDVKKAYRKAIDLFHPKVPFNAHISTKAHVDETAAIGRDVYIGPCAVVGANARIENGVVVMSGAIIGENCVVGEGSVIQFNAVLSPNTVVGRRVLIKACAVIGSEGFGFHRRETDGVLVRIPQVGRVIIEDDVEIGACTCIDRATLTETIVEEGAKIDNLVLIGHNVRIGSKTLIVGQTGIAGSTQIGIQTNIYGQAGIRGHLTIGEQTTILAGALVLKSTPAFCQVGGAPALPAAVWRRVVVSLKSIPGLLRRVANLEKCAEIRDNAE